MALKLHNESLQPEPARHADTTTPMSAAPRAKPASTVQKWRQLAMQREVIVLLAMVLFNLIFTPHFWSLQTFNVNMTQVVTIVIVGIGMTLVVATGGIDRSVGTVAALASVVAALTSVYGGWVAVLAGCAAGLAVGVLNGVIIVAALAALAGWLALRSTRFGRHSLAIGSEEAARLMGLNVDRTLPMAYAVSGRWPAWRA